MKDLQEADVKQATIAAEGSLNAAAEALGVTRSELVDYFASRPAMQVFFADLRDELLDDSQEHLREAVNEKAPWAIRRVLTTLGADRGYGPAAKPAGNHDAAKPKEAAIPATPSTGDTPNSAGNCQQAVPETQLPAPAPEMPMPAAPAVAMPAMGGALEQGIREALIRAEWHLTRAASFLNIPRRDLIRSIASRPALLSLATDVREALVDDAETALRLAVRDKTPWAICFVLNTLGRDQGYGRRTPRPAENRQGPPAAPANAAASTSANAGTMPAATAGTDQGGKPHNTTPENAPKDQAGAPSAVPPQPAQRLGDEPVNTLKSWLGPKG